jgi:outer membrane lipoprotein-sorting protein
VPRSPDGRVRLGTILAVCVLATSCRPATLRPSLPSALPSSARLLGVLQDRTAALSSVRGFAQIAYESGEDNVGARHAVLARRPDHFRLEVLSPLGALAVIASDARELVVYARRESKIYRGPASAESVGAYAQVPVAVADVTAILLGMPPVREPAGTATVTRDQQAGAFKLVVPIEGGRQIVWFEPETLVPVASETPLADGGKLRVAFGDYRAIGSWRFPHAVDMQAEPSGRAVRVRWVSPSLNTEITDTLFRIPPREGLEEMVIEQYGAGGDG